MSVPKLKGSVVVALAVLAGAPALAQDCTVRVNAMDVVVNTAFYGDGTTIRENMLSWPRRSLDRLTGAIPPCTSDVALAFMAGLEGLPNTDGYCLAEGNAQTGWLMVPGDRDYRGRCEMSTCQRINMAADEAIAMTDRMVLRLYQPPNPDSELMAHASGALVLTLGQRAIQQTIEDYGVAALAALLTAPEALGAASLSVVAVGGTMWLCNG